MGGVGARDGALGLNGAADRVAPTQGRDAHAAVAAALGRARSGSDFGDGDAGGTQAAALAAEVRADGRKGRMGNELIMVVGREGVGDENHGAL